MAKVYFITTAYPGISGSGGGALIRQAEAEILSASGFDTWVVIPDRNISSDKVDGGLKMIRLAAGKNKLVNAVLQKTGLTEDAGLDWINKMVAYLQSRISSDDILFCATGGDLDTVIAGSKLKTLTGCRFVINFHDPVINSHAFNKKIRLKSSVFFHVDRDKTEQKYLQNVDCVFTSSRVYQQALEEKYSFLKGKCSTFHFGYVKPFLPRGDRKKYSTTPLKIGYGGNMGKEQSPEILAKAVSGMQNTEAYFIGDIKSNAYLSMPHKNTHCIEYLSHDEYLNYMYENIDVAFLSLDGALSAFCVPSKLYEYINLGIPVIAAIKGDARRIIDETGIGITCEYAEDALRDAIENMKNETAYTHYSTAVALQKNTWCMKEQAVTMIRKMQSLAAS